MSNTVCICSVYGILLPPLSQKFRQSKLYFELIWRKKWRSREFHCIAHCGKTRNSLTKHFFVKLATYLAIFLNIVKMLLHEILVKRLWQRISGLPTLCHTLNKSIWTLENTWASRVLSLVKKLIWIDGILTTKLRQ